MSKSSKGFATACPANSASPLAGKQSGGVSVFIGGAVDNFTQMYTTPDGKFDSGYYIKENNFMMQAEMINYRKDDQVVFVETDIEYVPGKQGSDSEQGVLSAVGCDGVGFGGAWVPKRNSTGSVATDGFEIYRDGSIIVARG
jgi:hypothetical protein